MCIRDRYIRDARRLSRLGVDELHAARAAAAATRPTRAAAARAGLGTRVAFNPPSVVKLDGFSEPLGCEPMLVGEFRKHNDNDGSRFRHNPDRRLHQGDGRGVPCQ